MVPDSTNKKQQQGLEHCTALRLSDDANVGGSSIFPWRKNSSLQIEGEEIKT
jgi:hypothetical protein